MSRPIFDAVASGHSSVSPVTWNHNVGAGSNRFLFVGIFCSDQTQPVPTATYNGSGMQFIGQGALDPNTGTTFVYGQKNPASGNNQVSIAFTNTTDMDCGSISFSATDPTTPFSDFTSSGNNTSQTATLTISGTSNDIMVNVFGGMSGGSTPTPDVGQLGRWGLWAFGGGPTYSSGGYGNMNGSTVQTWTGNATNWQMSGIRIRGASVVTNSQTQTGLSNLADFASQVGRPGSDVTQGGWTSSVGQPLYKTISGLINGDPQSISSLDTASNTSEIHLSGLSTPTSVSGIVVTVRAKGDNTSATLTVGLYQGASLIQQQTFTLSTGFAVCAFLITPANAANITDYKDLRLRFTAGP